MSAETQAYLSNPITVPLLIKAANSGPVKYFFAILGVQCIPVIPAPFIKCVDIAKIKNCILNYTLPVGVFQDQCGKQTMINKYSNKHN